LDESKVPDQMKVFTPNFIFASVSFAVDMQLEIML
jgi:hypothetical protein